MFRFAVLGAGKIAPRFVEAARLVSDCEVTAVASKSLERAREFAQRNSIPHAYGSYEELLDAEQVDCAYIATVPSSHYEIAVMCLNRRVPVLCEKAMFRSAWEAEDAFARARAQNTFLMEALWSKFLPANEAARRWIQQGRIGKLAFLDAAIGFTAPKDAQNRYFNPDLGGGVALDVTVYAYEIAAYLVGMEPEIISVQVARYETGVDASELIAMRAGDCLCTLRTSFLTNLTEGLTITGELGRIVVPNPPFASEAYLYDTSGNLLEHFRDEKTGNGFIYEVREVVKCVQERRIESTVQPHSATLACARLFDRIAMEL